MFSAQVRPCRTGASSSIRAGSGCTTIPFRLKATKPTKGHDQVKVPVWYDPLIKLDVEHNRHDDWTLNARVYNEYDQHYDVNSQPVTLMFHPDLTFDGRHLIGTTSNSEGCCVYVFSPKLGTEEPTIEGRLIMNQELSLASNFRSLLSPEGRQSADLLLLTKDGRSVPCHKMLLQVREGTLWPDSLSVPLTRKEEESRLKVPLLQEFSSAAVERYIKIVYTGEISSSIGELDWANKDVQELAHIATKLGEKDLLKILCNIHAFETAAARKNFLEWYAPEKGDFEEQYWGAKKQEADEKLEEIHAAKWEKESYGY